MNAALKVRPCTTLVLPDRIGYFQLNYSQKASQSTKKQPRNYIARKLINHILLQWQIHKYTNKHNLIIDYY